MQYEEILDIADGLNLTVKEKPLRNHDGMIYGRNVAIRKDIRTNAEKAGVLSEEIGHYLSSAGDITDYNSPNNWKQEVRARTIGYDLMIGLDGLIDAYEAGCRNRYEIAEHIGCTEQYLEDAIKRYREIYGQCKPYKDYLVFFEPELGILRFL